jgi:hypothetical protein
MAERGELSALTSSLEELSRRITDLAERAGTDDELAAELFAIERALSGALRRLHRLASAAP